MFIFLIGSDHSSGHSNSVAKVASADALAASVKQLEKSALSNTGRMGPAGLECAPGTEGYIKYDPEKEMHYACAGDKSWYPVAKEPLGLKMAAPATNCEAIANDPYHTVTGRDVSVSSCCTRRLLVC